MDVFDIIEQYLKDNNFDGLINSQEDCSCELPDLEPCGNISTIDCVPGKLCPAYKNKDSYKNKCCEEQREKCQCNEDEEYRMFPLEKHKEFFGK